MALNLQPDPEEIESPARDADANSSTFSISPEPVIAKRNGLGALAGGREPALPRSYGSETLCLMVRDPYSLFAYWDIDWKAAFGEERPRARAVHLRILNADGSEQTALEVEPMAGSCDVAVDDADSAYYGEIGYFDRTGDWQAVRRSETVTVPAARESDRQEVDFATVPFHLSFQRMIDALRVVKEENQTLTAMLADLRARATTAERKAVTAQQHEVARALEAAVLAQPRSESSSRDSTDLWAHHRLDRVLGFGNASLSRGFGGSSRS
jgi:hypothetical protein